MKYIPRNVRLAYKHKGLTHFGGTYFLHEFIRVLQLRDYLSRRLAYHRRNSDYSVSQMLLALIYPIILGLDRIETASLLNSNGSFQYLTGLQSFPNPQTLRRFLLNAPDHLRKQLHFANDRLLQRFIHLPEHRSRLIFDLDSTVVPSFGHQEGAEVGYNPRYRGKRSYDPLLCVEARLAQYSVVARMVPSLKRALRGLRYEPMNPRWEIAEFEHRPHGWSHARRCIVAQKLIQESDPEPSLFTMGRYVYRAWHTDLPLTPAGVWHFYDGRAGMERRIREIRADYALTKIPTRAFAANALYLEVIRLAYNLVTAF